jgi:hypothetical protein
MRDKPQITRIPQMIAGKKVAVNSELKICGICGFSFGI